MYKQITKRQARKLWAENKPFYVNPCKMVCGGFWHTEMLVSPDMIAEYKENAKQYEHSIEYSQLWKGDINSTAWDLFYNNWAFYNTCYEMGYYAHYYVYQKGK